MCYLNGYYFMFALVYYDKLQQAKALICTKIEYKVQIIVFYYPLFKCSMAFCIVVKSNNSTLEIK